MLCFVLPMRVAGIQQHCHVARWSSVFIFTSSVPCRTSDIIEMCLYSSHLRHRSINYLYCFSTCTIIYGSLPWGNDKQLRINSRYILRIITSKSQVIRKEPRRLEEYIQRLRSRTHSSVVPIVALLNLLDPRTPITPVVPAYSLLLIAGL